MTQRGSLAVLVDGVAMPDEEARALWQRFSDWMEEHRGDLAGFAAKEGFLSVHPGVDKGRPVLLASKTKPQQPYGPARDAETRVISPIGGSESRQGGAPPPHARRRRRRK